MDPSKNVLILKNELSSNTFRIAMIFPMKMGQCFGYFPIDLGNGNGTQPEFRWFHWRTVYCLVTFILFLVELISVFHHTARTHFNFFTIQHFFFHLSGLLQFVLLFKLTYEWPQFVREWSKVEVVMRNYEKPSKLRLKLIVVTTSFMLYAAVDHVLVNAYKLKTEFDNFNNISVAMEAYFVKAYKHVFSYVEYSIWTGLLLQRTFNWSFIDVFIMLVGTALTFRMEQLSGRVEKLSRMKVNDSKQWKIVRKNYIRLTELCGAVNRRLSSIIIISFMTNLYFVLLQIFFSLSPLGSVLQKIYFFLSFGLVLVRIAGVCVFGGSVYEEWKNLGFFLNCVPTSAYNEEVERLACHVLSWELSLSGKNFFDISRNLILKIAGAVVTYELILIQFYKINF